MQAEECEQPTPDREAAAHEQPTAGQRVAASSGLPLSKEQQLCEQPILVQGAAHTCLKNSSCASNLPPYKEQQPCDQPAPIHREIATQATCSHPRSSSGMSRLQTSKEQQPHTPCSCLRSRSYMQPASI
uniref:Uncharacterized protein n=1 Tax=Myotis myotis TaxID=51298 RepID=A0A7J7YEX9_MYOMY|nr:hypothetical protein mMyoMyo1_011008 [Myotis myotis]